MSHYGDVRVKGYRVKAGSTPFKTVDLPASTSNLPIELDLQALFENLNIIEVQFKTKVDAYCCYASDNTDALAKLADNNHRWPLWAMENGTIDISYGGARNFYIRSKGNAEVEGVGIAYFERYIENT